MADERDTLPPLEPVKGSLRDGDDFGRVESGPPAPRKIERAHRVVVGVDDYGKVVLVLIDEHGRDFAMASPLDWRGVIADLEQVLAMQTASNDA